MPHDAPLPIARTPPAAYFDAMRNLWWIMLLAACTAPESTTPAPGADAAREALEVADFGPNPGAVRLFLYAPLRPRPAAGLVVALHGCLQTAADFQKAGWNALAEAHGFYVLYAQTSNPSGCFRWFEPGHAQHGEGESASIVAGVDWVLARYPVDRRKVSLTGLSAGAAMAVALLASSPDVFSAAAIFAGVPAGCASTSVEGVRCMAGVDLPAQTWASRVTARWPVTPQRAPRVQVWAGSLDTTVSPSMARELVEQWTALHGLDLVPEEREVARRITSEVHGPNLVQWVTVSGLGHGVPVAVARGCGAVGPFVPEADVCGALEAARFFGLIAAPEPVQVELLDGGGPVLDAGVEGRVADAGLPTIVCRESVASPTWHVWLLHAEVCGFFRTLVCAKGSQDLLGSTLSALPVTAWSVGGEVWHAGNCPQP